MGKKGAVMVIQQQWQAKGGYAATVGAYAALIGKHQQEECYSTLAAAEGSSNSSASAMRDPLARTKVVVRRLPPTLTEQAFVAQIEAKFATTYSWLSFRPGKSSHRNQVHSRAYIDFNTPEDVLNFHEDFEGHVFVNEKGSQYKAVVEYAPSQKVPDLRMKKDGREGSVLKDPDYLEFLETLSKPTELLPSAELQLERRESERLGSSKENPIVTPLMEYVRQRRAAKQAQRASKSGFRSIMGPPPSGFVIQKRGEKGKSALTTENSKEGQVYVRRERGRRRDAADFKERKREMAAAAAAAAAAADESSTHKESDQAVAGDGNSADAQRNPSRKLKDKEKFEGYGARGRPPVSPAQSSFKQTGYRERLSRGASPKGMDSGRSSKLQADSGANGTGPDGRRLRNKDRPDRPVWTPRRRFDAVDSEADSVEGVQGAKGSRGARAFRTANAQDVNEPENENGAFENGTYRPGSRKGWKDLDTVPEVGKHLKRGASPFGNNERQVWVAVQKTG